MPDNLCLAAVAVCNAYWSLTVTRNNLVKRDFTVLWQLGKGPREIGGLPFDSIKRLTALGLARRVLGSYEITRAGQLTYHRHHFSTASGRRIAHVTRRNPVFLHEARFRMPLSRSQLAEFLNARRKDDGRFAQAALLPGWLSRILSPAEDTAPRET